MNLLKDEKFKELLNFEYTFEEKLIELAKILSRYSDGSGVREKMSKALEFLVAIRNYHNSRREFNSQKVALDQMSRVRDQGLFTGDSRFQDLYEKCESDYLQRSENFLQKNYVLKSTIDEVLSILSSPAGDSEVSITELREAFDELRHSDWADKYPSFSNGVYAAHGGQGEESHEGDLLSAGGELEETKSALSEARSRIEELETQHEELTQEIEQLRDQAGEAIIAREEAESLSQEVASLHKQLEDAENALEEARKSGAGDAGGEEVESLRRENYDLSSRISNLEAEINHIRAEAESAKSPIPSISEERPVREAKVVSISDSLKAAPDHQGDSGGIKKKKKKKHVKDATADAPVKKKKKKKHVKDASADGAVKKKKKKKHAEDASADGAVKKKKKKHAEDASADAPVKKKKKKKHAEDASAGAPAKKKKKKKHAEAGAGAGEVKKKKKVVAAVEGGTEAKKKKKKIKA
ncbi:MAG: hypothetical protein NUW37_06950 [Planctomycetes bacterium]|nr:hypothetical protein [Planctomycetota bacterium]